MKIYKQLEHVNRSSICYTMSCTRKSIRVMSLLRPTVLTNDITVFVTTRIKKPGANSNLTLFSPCILVRIFARTVECHHILIATRVVP